MATKVAPARGQAGWIDPVRAPSDTKFIDKYGAPTPAELQNANAPGVAYVDPKVAAANAAKTAFNAAQQTDVTSGGTAPSGTMTAQITTPKALQKTVPPPAVVTSTAAEKDMANKKAQVDQLTVDTQNHQAAISTPQQTPVQDTATTKTGAPQDSGPQTLDDQISELLNGMNESDKNIDLAATDQITPLQQQQAAEQAQYDKAATASLQKLKQISTGTYPLSPAEKDLLSSTTQIFASTIQAQQTANSAFEGQLAETMASLGIETSAPTQAIGLMHAAISSGNGKVADLNAQMSQALANLRLGFQKEDYAEVANAWDETSKYMEDRITALKDMQTAVMDAAKQQKLDTKDYTSLALDYVVKSADFDYKAKQDAIDNAFKQQQIDETQRHDLQTEAVAWKNANTSASAASFKLTTGMKGKLLAGGFTAEEATQIANDVASQGIEATVAGLPANQQTLIRQVFSGSDKTTNTDQFLNNDYFANLFTDDQLKTAASDAGFRHYLSSWGTEKQNYLDHLMNVVDQYRTAGYTDQDILKQMQS